jgi:hypothetical protein
MQFQSQDARMQLMVREQVHFIFIPIYFYKW